jgi:hypothetical protein
MTGVGSTTVGRLLKALAAFVLVVGVLGAGGLVDAAPAPDSSGGDAASPAAVPGASTVTAVAPERVLDTRTFPATPATGSTVNLPIEGVGPVPDDGSVTAVVLNLVALDAVAQGWVTAYPHGTAMPDTSSLNVGPGEVQAAQVTVPVGADGSIDLFVSVSMNLVGDVVGYHQTATGPVSAGRTEGITPVRVTDTRDGGDRLVPGETLEVDLSAQLPADATAAIVTVTGVSTTGGGFLNVRPGGSPYDTTSSLNFDEAGDIVANQVLAKVSAGKTLTIETFFTDLDVLVDLTGYVTGGSAASSERGLFVPQQARLLDTRDVPGPASGRQTVSAVGSVPATGVAGLAVNVTLTETPGVMWASALPVGAPGGLTSTVNATKPGQTVAAPGTVFDGAALDVDLSAPAEVIVDLTGWYTDAAATEVLYRVNAGGDELAGDPVWTADSLTSPSPYRTAGSVATTANPIDTTDASVPAGTPAELFQTERYDPLDATDMTWAFPVVPGDYEVRLYFAETYFDTVGSRVFDVEAEGVVVLNDLDVFAEAGAMDKAIVRSFPVTSDGTLDLAFRHVVENPAVKAVEVIGSAAAAVPALSASPTSLALSMSTDTTQSTSVTVTHVGAPGAPTLDVLGTTVTGSVAPLLAATVPGTPVTLSSGQSTTVDVALDTTGAATGAYSGSIAVNWSGADGSSGTATVPVSLTVVGGVAPGEVLYRVNTGGPQLPGTPVWSTDTTAAPSPYLTSAASVSSTPAAIDTSDGSLPAGTPAELFQTERFQTGATPMTWAFPVQPGNYEVRMYFAETYLTTAGSRVFDVEAEGAPERPRRLRPGRRSRQGDHAVLHRGVRREPRPRAGPGDREPRRQGHRGPRCRGLDPHGHAGGDSRQRRVRQRPRGQLLDRAGHVDQHGRRRGVVDQRVGHDDHRRPGGPVLRLVRGTGGARPGADHLGRRDVHPVVVGCRRRLAPGGQRRLHQPARRAALGHGCHHHTGHHQLRQVERERRAGRPVEADIPEIRTRWSALRRLPRRDDPGRRRHPQRQGQLRHVERRDDHRPEVDPEPR